MKIAMIGLGRMGLNMATRLSKSGIPVIGYDIANIPNEKLPAENFYLKSSITDVINHLPSPRIVWLMLPSGAETEKVIDSLISILSDGDVIIDGANSNYRDTIKRGLFIAGKGYHFIDVGVSGGIWGLKEGYCLMVGGETRVVERLAPIFNALSYGRSTGWQHLGPLGAGHFAKMIHNGIEYGMMQAISEGLELCHSKKQLSIDTKKLIELWRHGSVIRSWLLDMLCMAMHCNDNLDEVLPIVQDSGEGRWFAIEAIEQGVATPVITQALNVRLQSQDNFGFGLRILSIMRNVFGGHKIHKK
jgi:6-phosphogluconate dehydrogenase